MKIEYSEPTVVDRIEEAIEQARAEGQRIKTIRLTAPELEEFCDIGGKAFNKQCVYTYKDLRVEFDS